MGESSGFPALPQGLNADWKFDPYRGQHYIVNLAENCYIYESGDRLDIQRAAQLPGPRRNSRDYGSRNNSFSQTAPTTILQQYQLEHYNQLSGISVVSNHVSQIPQPNQAVEQPQNEKVDEMEPVVPLTQNAVFPDTHSESSSFTGSQANDYMSRDGVSSLPNRSNSQSQNKGGGPKSPVADSPLASPTTGIVKGSLPPKPATETSNSSNPRSVSSIDSEFKIRRNGKKFFTIGKVIKVYWPEPLGQENGSTTVTSDARFEEPIMSKIRWFIIIKEGKNFCTCVPVNTYQNKGVSKKGVLKCQHAIVFSGDREPTPFTDELPTSAIEEGMLDAIRVRPRKPEYKLHERSRIDFARMYTVEHNIKVYDFGTVDKAFMEKLVSNWLQVLLGGKSQFNYTSHFLSPIAEPPPTPSMNEVETSMGNGEEYSEYQETESSVNGYSQNDYMISTDQHSLSSYSSPLNYRQQYVNHEQQDPHNLLQIYSSPVNYMSIQDYQQQFQQHYNQQDHHLLLTSQLGHLDINSNPLQIMNGQQFAMPAQPAQPEHQQHNNGTGSASHSNHNNNHNHNHNNQQSNGRRGRGGGGHRGRGRRNFNGSGGAGSYHNSPTASAWGGASSSNYNEQALISPTRRGSGDEGTHSRRTP